MHGQNIPLVEMTDCKLCYYWLDMLLFSLTELNGFFLNFFEIYDRVEHLKFFVNNSLSFFCASYETEEMHTALRSDPTLM